MGFGHGGISFHVPNNFLYFSASYISACANWTLMPFFWQIMRDPETGNSRGFGFISYDSFEASDAAIEVFFSFVYFCMLPLKDVRKGYGIWSLMSKSSIIQSRKFAWVIDDMFCCGYSDIARRDKGRDGLGYGLGGIAV